MMHGLGKKNYSEEGNLSLNLGRGEKKKKENKRNKPLWEGILPHLLLPKEVWRNRSRLSSGSPGGPPGGSLRRAVPGHHPLLGQASQPACHTGDGGGGHMHKSHNFMRVDVSLPPGIMRDRALAERDFVTFPEIFFFSVLSNRCRAMWEAGSLEGFEALSVLSTHSLRPFIWSKCSEKLPTAQRRRDKHFRRIWDRRAGEEGGDREKDKHWETEARVVHESMWCQANMGITQLVRERWVGGGTMKELSIQISFSLYTGPLILSRLHLTRRTIAL